MPKMGLFRDLTRSRGRAYVLLEGKRAALLKC